MVAMETKEELATRQILSELREYKPRVYSKGANRRVWFIAFDALPGGLKHRLRVGEKPDSSKIPHKWQLCTEALNRPADFRYTRTFDSTLELVDDFHRYYSIVAKNLAGEVIEIDTEF